jgi:hypothetical protein
MTAISSANVDFAVCAGVADFTAADKLGCGLSTIVIAGAVAEIVACAVTVVSAVTAVRASGAVPISAGECSFHHAPRIAPTPATPTAIFHPAVLIHEGLIVAIPSAASRAFADAL